MPRSVSRQTGRSLTSTYVRCQQSRHLTLQKYQLCLCNFGRVAAGEGQFELENAKAMKMWPHIPDSSWRGGAIRGGLLY